MTPAHDLPTIRRRSAVDLSVRRLLAGLVVILAVAVAACSTGVTRVDLAVLADEQEAWHGRLVEVTGTVQMFDDPRHHWVEDAEQHRVELVPSAGLDALVGRMVTVRGRFTFREGEGRRIEIQEIHTVDPAAHPGTARAWVAHPA